MLRRSIGLFSRNMSSFRQNARPVLSQEARAEREARKVFVSNINYLASWQELREHFERVGPVRFVQIVRNREDNRPRGIGFVEFEQQDDVERAIDELNGSQFMERELVVARPNPRPARHEQDDE